MVKHTQTICRQIADKLLSVFNHFVELALKGLSRFSDAFYRLAVFALILIFVKWQFQLIWVYFKQSISKVFVMKQQWLLDFCSYILSQLFQLVITFFDSKISHKTVNNSYFSQSLWSLSVISRISWHISVGNQQNNSKQLESKGKTFTKSIPYLKWVLI